MTVKHIDKSELWIFLPASSPSPPQISLIQFSLTEDDLDLLIPLPLPLTCWDYWRELPQPSF